MPPDRLGHAGGTFVALYLDAKVDGELLAARDIVDLHHRSVHPQTRTNRDSRWEAHAVVAVNVRSPDANEISSSRK